MADLNIKPLGDRVLVKRIEGGEKTAGGIVIPNTAKEKLNEGVVCAVGPGARKDDGTRIPLPVKVGDKIVYGKYSGSELKLEGEDYMVVREEDIIGIVG
jgi:chaperonin GroES